MNKASLRRRCPTKKILKWVTGLAVLAIWVMMLSLYWPYTVDDAYIVFRYARNWARGLGLVYNPDIPVDGYTSFLWTILVGFGIRLGIPVKVEVLAKIFGTLLSIITLWIVWQLPDWNGQSRPSRWIALLFTSVAPPLVISTIDGLETPLYCALEMALVGFWLSDVRKERLSLVSGLLAGLLSLTRPDGVLLVGIMLVLFLWFHRPQGWRKIWSASSFFVVGFGLLILPHFLWHLATYGTVFPNTFYAKGGGHPNQVLNGALRISAAILEIGGWATLIPVLLAFTEEISPYTAALTAVVVSRVLFQLWSGGEVMGHHRFLAPALPAYFLLFQHGLDSLRRRFCVRSAWVGRYGVCLVPILIAAHMGMAPLLDIRPALLRYAQGLEQAHIRLGAWLNQHTPTTARIAIGDAGAVPYYSDRYTIDLMGLNDAYLARLPGRFGQKVDILYVFSQQPDYLILLSSSPPGREFRGLTAVDQALYEAVISEGNFRLHGHYEFGDSYFLWVFCEPSDCYEAN